MTDCVCCLQKLGAGLKSVSQLSEKADDWQKFGEVKGNQAPVIDFDFGKQLSTVKIKIVMTKVHPGMTMEFYEIELYE